MATTQRRNSSATTPPAGDKPAETETQADAVEVAGTGPDGEWRAETHGESPADRPKSEF